MKNNLIENKKTLSYFGLIFVVLVWGTGALTTKYFLDFYSPTLGLAFVSLISVIVLGIILRKKLKNITAEYFKVAIPLGIFYTAADVFQKIGLQYTTPTIYSFLENLSCIVVPFLIWFLIKKKPTWLQIIGSIICLASAFILSGMGNGNVGFSLGIGEILCGLAGIFYGVNIAGTSVYTKKFDSALYIMVLMAVEFVLTSALALCFHFIKIDGTPIEPMRFSFNPWMLLLRTSVVLISCVLCWIIRTSSMKHVDATVVAVMMPFSAIITGILSVLFGMDTLSVNLVVGAILGLVAMIICAFGDIQMDKKNKTD